MKCVLWIGRHELLPAQLEFLRDRLGCRPALVKYAGNVTDRLVERMVRELREAMGCEKVVVTGTMPLTVYARLAEAAKRSNEFEVWYPVMKTLAEAAPREEAERLVKEAPERRTYVCYPDGCKVVEFEKFARLTGVKLLLEDI